MSDDINFDDINCDNCKTKICNECSLKGYTILNLWIKENEGIIQKPPVIINNYICDNCKTKICNECSLEVYGIKLRLLDPEKTEEEKK